MRERQSARSNKAAFTQTIVNSDKPFETWRFVLKNNPQIRNVAIVIFIKLIFVELCSFERDMFLDQFLTLSLLGNIFIWLQVNLIFSVKIAIGKLLKETIFI